MFSKTPFRRVLLFAITVYLALTITACNRRDDGVSVNHPANQGVLQNIDLTIATFTPNDSATSTVNPTPSSFSVGLYGPFLTPVPDADGWYTRNDKQYKLTTWKSWVDAEQEAVSLGGHLATINDEAENTWLATTFLGLVAQGGAQYGRSGAFIGYYKSGISWKWISGEPVTYTNLFYGFPYGGTHAYLHTADHPYPGAPFTWNAAPWHTDGVYGPAYLLKGIIERSAASFKITQPANNDIFGFNENISFVGSETGTVTNIEWVENGVVLAQGISASKSDLNPGTHTITLRGISAGSPIVSDPITIFVIKSIKIKDLETGQPPVVPFRMSSIRGIKKFRSVGCFDDAGNIEFKPVKVKWSLPDPDGKLDPAHTVKKEILNLLDSNRGKIGVLVDQNGTYTQILDTDTVTFVSYFSGNITLKAEFRTVISKTLSIGLNQPTFSVKIWHVHGVGAIDNTIINVWQQRTYEAWEKDAIFRFISVEKSPEIQNVVYPNSPLGPLPEGFECAEPLLTSKLGEIPSFLNPILFDYLLVKNFGLNLLPRQPHVLFSQRDEPSINAYVVEKARIYGLSPFDLTQMIFSPQVAVSPAKDNYYNFDSPGRLDDNKRSGITISRQTTPLDFRQETILSHEIGHILIQKDGLEDNDIPGNLMNTGETGGLDLSPEQYIAIFNFDGKKDHITSLIWEL